MHGVNPDITRLAIRLRPAPLPGEHSGGSRFGYMDTPLTVNPVPAQVIDMRHRN